MTERALHPGVAQWTVQGLARLMATYAILLGLTILLSGSSRWVASAYATALAVPGAPSTWGVLLVIPGVIALAGSLLGRYRVVQAGLYLIAVWCLFFAIAFAQSALRHPDAPFADIFTYGTYAVICLVLGAAHREHRGRPGVRP